MMLDFVCKCVCLSLIWSRFGGNCQDFGYDGDEGPNHWSAKYSTCAGKLQSPINIDTNDVITTQLPPLIFHHFGKPLDVVLVENNGHTVTLKTMQDFKPTLQGGPLEGTYIFSQLHFHWGPNDTIGSENKINQKSFPLELHLVMYNPLYGAFENALNNPNGIAVLAFLFEIGSRDNEKFDQFIDGLNHVRAIMARKTLNNFVSLDMLIAEDRRAYFTYDGSLTTPPCSELVKWIEFEKTVPMSKEQLEAFRFLSTKHGRLTHNFRPTQPTNNRLIYYNNGNGASSNLRGTGTLSYFAIVYLVIVQCCLSI